MSIKHRVKSKHVFMKLRPALKWTQMYILVTKYVGAILVHSILSDYKKKMFYMQLKKQTIHER